MVNVAAKPTVNLCQFQACIAAADYDQMRRQVVEFKSLDMGERSGGIEAGNTWNGGMRSDVEEQAIARQQACPSVIQGHLECFWR